MSNQTRLEVLEKEVREQTETLQRHRVLAAQARKIFAEYGGLSGRGTNSSQCKKADNLLLEIACGPAALASGEKGKETT